MASATARIPLLTERPAFSGGTTRLSPTPFDSPTPVLSLPTISSLLLSLIVSHQWLMRPVIGWQGLPQKIAPVGTVLHRLTRSIRDHLFNGHVAPAAANRLVECDNRADMCALVEQFPFCLDEQCQLRVQHALKVRVALQVECVRKVE